MLLSSLSGEGLEQSLAPAAILGAGSLLILTEHPLSRLNFLFIPVILTAYFYGRRRAVALAAAFVVVFAAFFALHPAGVAEGIGERRLPFHFTAWGLLLVGAGALVGNLGAELRKRQALASRTIDENEQLRKLWSVATRELEQKAETLQTSRRRLEAVLNSAMDPVVAKLIIDRRLRNEKRQISVLFSDLVNFTEHSQGRPPEEVIQDLNRYFGEMGPTLSCFHGHLDKFLGDGLMAEFGSPYPARHHPLLATLAGLKMQERLQEKSFPWKMRIGIATGGVLVGLIGSETRRNYTAVGDSVNLSARLQAICPPGSVCVDETCFRFVERWCLARPMRKGLNPQEAAELEARLGLLDEAISQAPTRELCLEAADLASELERMDQARKYHQRAVELAPPERRALEAAIAGALLTGQERAFLSVKGKRVRVPAYEITGLKDFLKGPRLPPKAADLYKSLSAGMTLPEEDMLAIEALEGSLGHAQVTAALSACLADSLGFGEEQVRGAFLAGFFSDAGKRRVPEHLLSCPENLEELPPSDRELMQGHVGAAGPALEALGIELPREVLEAVAQHHERWDGSGYPKGLKGDRIGPLGQIVGLADGFESLTAWRPYQEAWSVQSALAEIRKDIQDGSLDPKVGKVFLAMMGA